MAQDAAQTQLPSSPEPPRPAGREAPADPDTPIRVLLVEDNDDHAELVIDALERSGEAHFDVQRVSTSAEALDCAAPGAFNALLLDYGLSDLDGVALLERLRDGGTDTPALLL
ncbi:MAG: response regulator transcription factor, partial [Chloroflexota bacterium]